MTSTPDTALLGVLQVTMMTCVTTNAVQIVKGTARGKQGSAAGGVKLVSMGSIVIRWKLLSVIMIIFLLI